MFLAALFIITTMEIKLETSKMSITWKQKKCYVQTMEYYSAIKRNKIQVGTCYGMDERQNVMLRIVL